MLTIDPTQLEAINAGLAEDYCKQLCHHFREVWPAELSSVSDADLQARVSALVQLGSDYGLRSTEAYVRFIGIGLRFGIDCLKRAEVESLYAYRFLDSDTKTSALFDLLTISLRS